MRVVIVITDDGDGEHLSVNLDPPPPEWPVPEDFTPAQRLAALMLSYASTFIHTRVETLQ